MLSVLSLGILAAGCDTGSEGDASPDGGDSPDTGDDTGSADDLGYKACDLDEKVGEFRVELADLFTAVNGNVSDGVVPLSIPNEVDQVDECRLLRVRDLACDPACTAEQTCDEGNTCVPYPRRQPVGTVTVSGLKEAVSMEPGETSFYMFTGELPHPGFDPGANIGLSATGGDYAPFELRGVGIEPLEIEDVVVAIEPGKPLELEWSPPLEEGPARMRLELNLSMHGGTSTWIECVVEDTGSYSIPAGLVSQLVEFGYSGWPILVMSRRTAARAQTDLGCVEFLVVSETDLSVSVPGLTSCQGDDDCPDGQTCLGDLTCG